MPTDDEQLDDSKGENEPRHEVLLWHDKVHEEQDQSRLHFWRLSFTPSYEREKIFERLQEFYEGLEITSHATYETLGDYDLLLRMWIPKTIGPDEVELALYQALQTLKLWNVNYVTCRTELHWAQPSESRGGNRADWPTRADPVISEVTDFNLRQFSQKEAISRSPAIDKLISCGVLRPVSMDTRGVRLFITFDHPRVPFNPVNRRVAVETIRDTCTDVVSQWRERSPEVPIPQISFYEGLGTMTDFLVMARAPHTWFHDFVQDLSIRLRQTPIVTLYDMRPYTHVIADRMFTDFAEDRAARPTPRIPRIAMSEEESQELEFKATFGLDLRQFMFTGTQTLDPSMTHEIVRAVCGLLNADGGTVVIGVLELQRELERIKERDTYLTQLRDRLGIDLLDMYDGTISALPAKIVIGIEAEVGRGLVFEDRDQYQQRLVDILRRDITPNPLHHMKIAIQKVDGKHLCVIAVQPGEGWSYASERDGQHHEFFVREGVSTNQYSGEEADRYKNTHQRGPDVI
jgi:Putative DNA-binding domain